MRKVMFAVAIVAPIASSAMAAPQPQSREALYLKCSREVAQRYGQPGIQYSTKSNYRVIPHTHITIVDQCVANGGRVN
jgi:hypothetical protein